ncbi:PD-(D/E)XK nuclease family protein [Roseimarinus sediminis]|uniref:PD-(D/E)XK nuclease family protein n=1 Tax=Roseimarinus sediminis TaxID=1610899 RepID=UPI003D1E733A
MDKFLGEVADYLFKRNSNELDRLTVVFPNRRAGLFFQKYLSTLSQRPFFSPNIITISELVSELASVQLIENNRLVTELYEVYSRLLKSNETLDDFFYWGEMMLSDFNDLDKYLVDARQLFQNIQSLREIDSGFDFLSEEQLAYLSTFWLNVLEARNSGDKEKFIGIWKNLFKVYEAFKKQLAQKGWAYEGMMYRLMTEKLLSSNLHSDQKHFALIGFNALNACEKKLFDYLKVNHNAQFFWDYDDYYIHRKHHEAALFMKDNLQRYPMPDDFVLSFNHFSSLKEIDLVAVPGFSGQAGYAASWIEKNSATVSTRFDNTAIVLCDETLLLPVINSIPDSVGELNITMGYPVKGSPAYALIKNLIDIDKHSRKDPTGKHLFYYRNVLGLLSNPLLKRLLGDVVDQLGADVRDHNKIYLGDEDFSGHDLLKTIFTLPENAADCRSYLQLLLKTVFNGTPDDEYLLKEALYQLYLAVNRMHESLFSEAGNQETLFSKSLYYQLLLRQLDRLSIPFEGEPLSGMQIMGFLETRSLDFDHLVLLSFNDEKLPGNPHQHSFIPYSLRKGFGLPVIEQRNAMYAYYFYRLIQRAKKVSLVYDSRSDGMSGGEVSRYATQLKYEADHLKVNEIQAVFDFEPAEVHPVTIEKSAALYQRLTDYLQTTRISPSALNAYIDCKLKFYFKYIEGIKATDEIFEDIDHLIFGRIAHVALEELYLPFVGKEVSAEMLDALLSDKKRLNASLQKALEKEYFKQGKMVLNGRNLLVFDIIKKYVIRIIRYDQSIVPFRLISLEKVYENTVEVPSNDGPLTIRFGGTVDRLDQMDDKIRVLDYKTGVSENKLASIDLLFKDKSSRNKAAFQTMLYASCVHHESQCTEALVPAVYGARDVFVSDFSPFFTHDGNTLVYQANAEEFMLGLKDLLAEIADRDIPFDQTTDENHCKYCDYSGICRR